MRPLAALAVLALSLPTGDRGPVPSDGLRIFRGDGYTFAYPDSATVTPRARGVEITGPRVDSTYDPYNAHATAFLPEPLYRLSVDVMPVDSLAADTTNRVSFVRGTRAVVFQFTVGHDENVFPALQRVLYDQIVSSFRWNTPSDTATPSRGVAIYHGDGYTMAYPISAKVTPGHDWLTDLKGTAFVGPEITARVSMEDHDTVQYSTKSFEMFVSVQPNPGRLSAQQWADSLVAKDHRRYVQQADSDSDEELQPPDTLTVAGLPAVFLSWPCGDCGDAHIYVARGDRVVMFNYEFFDNSSLPDMQRAIYAHMLASFRWTNP